MALLLARATAGAVSLAGHADAAADFDANFDVARALSSHADAAAHLTGVLAVDRPLTAHADAANGATGALGIDKGLSAHGDAAADFAGDIAVARGFAGNSNAASGVTGDLTVTGGGIPRDLAGTIAAANYAVGNLTVTGLPNVFSEQYNPFNGTIEFTIPPTILAGILGEQFSASGGAAAYTMSSLSGASVTDQDAGAVEHHPVSISGGIT
jgi:hypothetical protein